MPAARPPPGDPGLPPEVITHYGRVEEARRLTEGEGPLEAERTRRILARRLPDPPATVLDVGGGTGSYALWLSGLGYEVHLLDAVEHHVEQARTASGASSSPLASVELGDARRLTPSDDSIDVVLMLGPLYHLTERIDRHRALSEARRVLRPGGLLFAAAISRFASAIDGLVSHFIADPVFQAIVDRDLAEGQHRNPAGDPRYFTTAFFHHPRQLSAEVTDAGFTAVEEVAVEGVGWAVTGFADWWGDATKREILLDLIERLETEPSLLGASPHLMAIAVA